MQQANAYPPCVRCSRRDCFGPDHQACARVTGLVIPITGLLLLPTCARLRLAGRAERPVTAHLDVPRPIATRWVAPWVAPKLVYTLTYQVV
jgi:hypothetical protein